MLRSSLEMLLHALIISSFFPGMMPCLEPPPYLFDQGQTLQISFHIQLRLRFRLRFRSMLYNARVFPARNLNNGIYVQIFVRFLEKHWIHE